MKHDDSSGTTPLDSNGYINNLPNELLARIFSTVANRWQDPRELPSPILLSSICCHWRMLAQSTPDLWINIIVPLNRSAQDCIAWTAEWMTRSGVLPVSITLDVIMWKIRTPSLDWIMALISEHSERLRRFTIRTFLSSLIDDVLSGLPSAPNLQQLTICCESEHASYPQGHHWQEYSLDFPRLTTMKVHGWMVPSIPSLTSLTIDKLYGPDSAISQMLTASPGLKHLTLRHLLPLPLPLSQLDVQRVDSLRSLAVSLRLNQPPARQSNYMFKYLDIPNIKYLELDGDSWKVSHFGQSLSSAKIDTLRISNRSEMALTIGTVNFLHSFSTVRHLQLVHTSTRGLLGKNAYGLVRKNSIGFRQPSRPNAPMPTNFDIMAPIQTEPSSSATAWPELQTITLDTLAAGDVLNLCEFITCHKHVQVVELSKSAKRHLSWSLCRKDDRIYQRPSLFKAEDSEETLNDVEEWLGKMVDIRALNSPSVGLLDAD